jgi:hypothetical protein
LLTAWTAAARGCGGGPKNPVVPVAGTIAFADGSPLPAGTRVVFNPTDGGVGTASGTTAADGSFEVEHVTGRTGAEVGKYQVALLAPEDGAGNFWKLVPKEYADGQVLSAEVKEGMAPLTLKVAKLRRR